ncbi:uncharacterized protein LOC143034872 [Oratosquilla oratoria]|uniref:uncharacterized protein LOC143034872 n=1 Tax=Oratosquilla oratoria TaxID=337810 RepID=UPI003F765275
MAPAKRQQVSEAERNRIVSLHKDELSLSEISRAIGRSRSIVQRIVARFKQSGNVKTLPKTGRPRKTNAREDRTMVRQSMQDRFKTAAEISREMGETSSGTVSRFTVSRRLKQAGLLARVPAEKPLISVV